MGLLSRTTTGVGPSRALVRTSRLGRRPSLPRGGMGLLSRTTTGVGPSHAHVRTSRWGRVSSHAGRTGSPHLLSRTTTGVQPLYRVSNVSNDIPISPATRLAAVRVIV